MTDKAIRRIEPEAVPAFVGVDPNFLLGQASRMATALAKLVQQRQLYKMISGRKYILCEGWTALASLNGVTPHEVSVTELDGVYVAVVELRRMSDGQVIARASAECGAPDELDRQGKPVWSTRPRYARRSMALTRATAKACRLAFSWIVALAGMEFSTTPAEEVPDGGFAEAPPGPPAPDTPASEAPEAPGDVPWPVGARKGQPLRSFTTDELVAAKRWIVEKGKAQELLEPIDRLLAARGAPPA
jgi:hypothetical protein